MSDFTFRDVLVEDIWPSGARRLGSQTRYQSRRRVDGSQRYLIHTDEPAYAFTKEQARELIRQQLAELDELADS